MCVALGDVSYTARETFACSDTVAVRDFQEREIEKCQELNAGAEGPVACFCDCECGSKPDRY